MNSKAQVALHICVRSIQPNSANKVEVGNLVTWYKFTFAVCRIRDSKSL